MNKKLGHNFDELKVFYQFYVTFDDLIEFPDWVSRMHIGKQQCCNIFVNFEDELSSHVVVSSADRGTKGASMTGFYNYYYDGRYLL